MSRSTDQRRLLADVLAEAEPTGFRAALLGETLRLAGSRRRARRLRQATTALAVLGLFGTLAWRFLLPGHGFFTPTATSCAMVRTEPLPPEAIIRTQPFAADCIVVSVASVEVIHTTPNNGKLRNLNDDELLALVAPRPAALVRVGPQSAKLIFLNPEDQKDFPVN
jgi:hypothetical protein